MNKFSSQLVSTGTYYLVPGGKSGPWNEKYLVQKEVVCDKSKI